MSSFISTTHAFKVCALAVVATGMDGGSASVTTSVEALNLKAFLTSRKASGWLSRLRLSGRSDKGAASSVRAALPEPEVGPGPVVLQGVQVTGAVAPGTVTVVGDYVTRPGSPYKLFKEINQFLFPLHLYVHDSITGKLMALRGAPSTSSLSGPDDIRSALEITQLLDKQMLLLFFNAEVKKSRGNLDLVVVKFDYGNVEQGSGTTYLARDIMYCYEKFLTKSLELEDKGIRTIEYGIDFVDYVKGQLEKWAQRADSEFRNKKDLHELLSQERGYRGNAPYEIHRL